MTTGQIIRLMTALVAGVGGVLLLVARLRVRAVADWQPDVAAAREKRRRKLGIWATLCLWLTSIMVGGLIQLTGRIPTLYVPGSVDLGPLTVTQALLWGWIALVAVALVAVALRVRLVARFSLDAPSRGQCLLEAVTAGWNRFCRGVARVVCAMGRGFAKVGRWIVKKITYREQDPVLAKAKKRRNLIILAVLAGWVLVGVLFSLIPGEKEAFTVSVEPDKVPIGPFQVASSVVLEWCIIAAILLAALVIRRVILPKFSQGKPGRFQNVLELIVETAENYAHGQTQAGPALLPVYIVGIGVLLVCSAAVEMLGFRSPAADLNMTLAMAIMTFVLINVYAIRKKGVWGRVKAWGEPSKVVFPIRVLSDIATPVSLACRLFGNILGGMIVVELIYYALGSFSVGIPAVLGLYFNAFHPLIQAFIFITLSLSFINEAYE